MTLAATAMLAEVLAAARPFFERHLPAPLLAEGPRGLLWWQWLAIPVLLVFALLGGIALGWITRRVLGHLASRTRTSWDDVLLARVARPLASLWAIAVFTAVHPWLHLDAGSAKVVEHLLRAATYLVFFWAGLRSLDVAFDVAGSAAW